MLGHRHGHAGVADLLHVPGELELAEERRLVLDVKDAEPPRVGRTGLDLRGRQRLEELRRVLGDPARRAPARRPERVVPAQRPRRLDAALHHLEHGRALVPDVAVLARPRRGGPADLARLVAMRRHPPQPAMRPAYRVRLDCRYA